MTELFDKFMQSLTTNQIEILKQLSTINITYNDYITISNKKLDNEKKSTEIKKVDDIEKLEARYKELRQKGVVLKPKRENINDEEKELLTLYNKIYRIKIIKVNSPKKKTSMFD
ncbi:MAG: hypothetical protein BGO27_03585 [Alphaproteobacteria bacterium 33-17]|nr:MAG: hypothetical protein BGO27_03585 [Alphaproteobacteria bacterium 33-17]